MEMADTPVRAMKFNPFKKSRAKKEQTNVYLEKARPVVLDEPPWPPKKNRQLSDFGTVRLFRRVEGSTEWQVADGVPAERLFHQFNEFGIVFHFLFWPARASEKSETTRFDGTRADQTMDPIERDLLTYNIRDLENRPFQSRLHPFGADDHKKVRVTFPQAIKYRGEGPEYCIVQCHSLSTDNERTVMLDATTCTTRFRNGSVAFHLGFFSDGKRGLTDLELIALAKLWEGGENYDRTAVKFDNKPILDFAEEHMQRIFSLAPERTLVGSIFDLVSAWRPFRRKEAQEAELLKFQESKSLDSKSKVEEESGDWVHLVGGTIQAIDETAYNALDEILTKIDEPHSDEPKLSEADKQFGWGLKGIETGLLDIFNVDKGEINDSLGRFVQHRHDKDRLAAANKGTLFAICREDRLFDDHHATMSVSPYLWLPNVVSIYNYMVLNTADQVYRHKQPLKVESVYQDCESRIRSLAQEQYLRRIFHYPLEQDIDKRCQSTRGNAGQFEIARTRLRAINGSIQEMREKRERALGWVIQILVGFLAILQVGSAYEQLRSLVDKSELPYASLLFSGVCLVLLVPFFSWMVYVSLRKWQNRFLHVVAYPLVALFTLALFSVGLRYWLKRPELPSNEMSADIDGLRNAVKAEKRDDTQPAGDLLAILTELSNKLGAAYARETAHDDAIQKELTDWHNEEKAALERLQSLIGNLPTANDAKKDGSN